MRSEGDALRKELEEGTTAVQRAALLVAAPDKLGKLAFYSSILFYFFDRVRAKVSTEGSS